MHPPTPNPTETSLGMFNEREDLLGQVARKSRVARWGRAIARVAAVFSVMILAVLVVAGPGETIGWLGTYLFAVGVILGVVIAVLALLMWALEKLPTSSYRDRWQ